MKTKNSMLKFVESAIAVLRCKCITLSTLLEKKKELLRNRKRRAIKPDVSTKKDIKKIRVKSMSRKPNITEKTNEILIQSWFL